MRKFILHAATLTMAASALAACTYHRTVVEEHPVRTAPVSETTVVVPPNGSVTVVEPN